MLKRMAPVFAATAVTGIAWLATGLPGPAGLFGQQQAACAPEPQGQPSSLENGNGAGGESRGASPAPASEVLRELRADRARRADAAARSRARNDADGDPRDALLISFEAPVNEKELQDVAAELRLSVESVVLGRPAGTDYLTTNLLVRGDVVSESTISDLRLAYRSGLEQNLDSSRQRQRGQFHEAQDRLEANLQAALRELDAGGPLRIVAITASGPDGVAETAGAREDMVTARRDAGCAELRHLTPDRDLVFIAEQTRGSVEPDLRATPLPAPGESR